MKTFVTHIIFTLGAATFGLAQPTAADADWQVLQAISTEQPPGGDSMLVDQRMRWSDANAARYGDRALDFFRKHSGDPRRWEALMHMLERPRMFFSESQSAALPSSATDIERLRALTATIDREAMQNWRKKLDALTAAMEQAADVPIDVQERYDAHRISRGSYRANPTHSELADMLLKINTHVERFPSSRQASLLAARHLSRVERIAPELVTDTLQKMASSPHADVRQMAEGKLRAARLREEPLELAFIALDGRKVDLADLRGKVVLVDFWATWCAPCKAEIPNVKAAYDKYHGHGFEVIAVSLDRKTDRKKLEDYVRDHQLPWPQHFVLDEKGRNVLAEKLGITSIPAPYLFDQAGRLVATDARGPKLEAEVKRLLGL